MSGNLRISTAYRPGWLLFAGNLGGQDTAVAGDAWAADFSMKHSLYSRSIRLTAEMREFRAIRGASREQGLWEALQGWPQPGAAGGRRWPAEMEALLALARNHPEEYGRLRDGEAVLRALGG